MNESIWILIAGYIYLASMVFHMIGKTFRKNSIIAFAVLLSSIGLLSHVSAFILRWFESYKVNGYSFFKSMPVTTLNESLLFFCLVLVVIYMFGVFKFGWKMSGVFITGFAGSLILFVDVVSGESSVKPLVPVLQSNWLIAHVTLSFIAYVFFTLSATSALLYLILESKLKYEPSYLLWTLIVGAGVCILSALFFDSIVAYTGDGLKSLSIFSATLGNDLKSAKVMYIFLSFLIMLFFLQSGLNIRDWFLSYGISSEMLNELVYKFVIIGFVIFTLGGLIFGAIWAETAWGRYWSWDPKETWALITWLIYGVYLHAKSMKKLNDKALNSIALIAFIVTMFTYLGVNLLLSGLHSYS